MAILQQNNFTGGALDVDITVANSSAGGSAFGVIESSAGTVVNTGIVKYSTTVLRPGSAGSMRTNGNGANQNTTVAFTEANTALERYLRFYVRRSAIPGVTLTPFRSAKSGALASKMRVTATTGVPILDDAAGAAVATGTGSLLVANEWTRVELRVKPGITTAGEIEMRFWRGDAACESTGAPTETLLANGVALLEQHGTFYMGQNSSNNLGDTFFAEFAVGDVTWLGPAVAPPVTQTQSRAHRVVISN